MPRKKSHRRKFELVLRSRLTEIAKVERFLRKINNVLRLDEVRFNKLYLATTEAVTNGIIHGNKQDPTRHVRVICETNSRSVKVRVYDEGKGHDFGRIPNPLMKKNLWKENGRGIFLIRTLMDSVEWKKRSAGTEIIMKMKVR